VTEWAFAVAFTHTMILEAYLLLAPAEQRARKTGNKESNPAVVIL
jgi:hypothetical protein